MRKMMKYIALFVWLCFSMNVFSAQRDDIDWHNKELVIKGEYLHAVLVAEKDFSVWISSRASKLESHGTNINHKLAEYLSKIDNYNIEIGFGRDRYLVWITPRVTDEFPIIFGADALYTIDRKTFQVIDKQYGK